MRLQMGRVDHESVGCAALIGEFQEHPGEDALFAPTLPAAIKRLVRPIFRRRITPPQPIAIDEDYPAQHPLVINPRLAVGLREERLKLGHLIVRQPVKIAHVIAPFSEP